MIPFETRLSLITFGWYIYLYFVKQIEHDNFFIFTHTGLFSSHNRAFGDEINQPTRPVFFPIYFPNFQQSTQIFSTHYQGNPQRPMNIREAAWLIFHVQKS